MQTGTDWACKRIAQPQQADLARLETCQAAGVTGQNLRPFDFDSAMQNLGGDRELLCDALRLFLETTPITLVRMREDAIRRAGPALRCSAHGLKGAAANVGAIALSQAALRLELAAEAEDFDNASPLLNEVQGAYQQLKTAAGALLL